MEGTNPQHPQRGAQREMPARYVEVWRSKSAWQTADAGKREQTLAQFRQFLQSRIGGWDASYGPHLHRQGQDELLIWEVPSYQALDLQKQYGRLSLARYFEPLMVSSDSPLTALAYVKALRVRFGGSTFQQN